MTKIMWAVFNTRHSATPRALFSNKDDADRYHEGMHWGITQRVEIDYLEDELVVIIRAHEYRYIEPVISDCDVCAPRPHCMIPVEDVYHPRCSECGRKLCQ